MQVIVWSQDSGVLAVTIPTGEVPIDQVAARVAPSDRPHFIIDSGTLPIAMNNIGFGAVRMSATGILSVDAAALAKLTGSTDSSSSDNLPKIFKAVLLASAALSGKTPAQAKAAFLTAWNSLP